MQLPVKATLKNVRFFLLNILVLIEIGAIIAIPEILLLFYLAQHFGKFTIIAVIMGASVTGLFVTTNSVRVLMHQIKYKFSTGVPPHREISMCMVLIISGYLLIAPGLIGFALGLLLYYTPLNIGVRKILQKKLKTLLMVLYYYMKVKY